MRTISFKRSVFLDALRQTSSLQHCRSPAGAVGVAAVEVVIVAVMVVVFAVGFDPAVVREKAAVGVLVD